MAEALGLDYNEFVFRGIDVAELRATGNAFALALAEQAERECQENVE
ncbi:hypothetical protein [Pseudomonas peli]|nr:hypothetical protein [Pseudomonas peli]MDR7024403.1 hypothetical protein [Pseudomonas peli]